MAKVRIGRNDTCPCGSGKKFKKCCQPKGIPWEDLLGDRDPRAITNLTIRGRNLTFLNHIAGILQIDDFRDWTAVKRACTARAVRSIHESLVAFWPNEIDYISLLQREKGNGCGLYVGNYDPDFILQGITRHSIYSGSIILFDPFLDPRPIKPEFNPVNRPERYRTTTLKNLHFWLTVAPWIDAGLVKIVPSPTAFDPALARQVNRAQRQKVDNDPHFRYALAASSEFHNGLKSSYASYLVLHSSNETLAADFSRAYPAASEAEVRAYFGKIEEARSSHPYFLSDSIRRGDNDGEMLLETSGASYPIAKIVANLSGAHFLTDLPSKWYEIEIDRAAPGSVVDKWTPFSKAFQSVDFPFLNEVPLDAALTLRKEERLQRMRDFLQKIWKENSLPDAFSGQNAEELAAELRDRIAEAETEWNEIDRELAKWAGGEAAVTAAVGVATGNFLAAVGFVIAGATNLGVAHWKRLDFEKTHPAAFFMKLKRRKR